MDGAGKDSAIKHLMRGLNPQGVSVTSFKHPTNLELEHGYLWRHAQKMPEHGQIGIFNRSHYENLHISKVHPEIILSERLPGVTKIKDVNKKIWQMRNKQINDFEKRNIENGTYIVKIFLHLSKEEQCKRFIDRIEHRINIGNFHQVILRNETIGKSIKMNMNKPSNKPVQILRLGILLQ
jgi:polyphosphate kinase 2 (PPK2 family)